MKRQQFIRTTSLATGAFLLNTVGVKAQKPKLTILHTNDWHSRIEPFAKGDAKYAGLGGAAKRAALIKKIRAEGNEVLLLDSGDIFQGTPYFNLFKGKLEFELMSEMGYDAATLGNHDFDLGLEGLNQQLPYAKFPFVIANYNFENTILKGKFAPFKIFNRGGFKVGVFGVGIELDGLVSKNNFGETQYLSPIVEANKTAALLKEKSCDLIVCLSHLGYQYNSNKISDIKLAQSTKNIDIILGGHTHTFMEKPAIVKNHLGENVIINQTGWAGINLGRIDIQRQRISPRAEARFSMLKIR